MTNPHTPHLTIALRKGTRLLQDKRPDQLKLPFCLWTREAVVLLLARECGVQVSVWTAGRMCATRRR